MGLTLFTAQDSEDHRASDHRTSIDTSVTTKHTSMLLVAPLLEVDALLRSCPVQNAGLITFDRQDLRTSHCNVVKRSPTPSVRGTASVCHRETFHNYMTPLPTPRHCQHFPGSANSASANRFSAFQPHPRPQATSREAAPPYHCPPRIPPSTSKTARMAARTAPSAHSVRHTCLANKCHLCVLPHRRVWVLVGVFAVALMS